MERICRKYFEEIFEQKFPKIRPKWLKSDKYPLELDGYCENLKLAFEYQGIQHYESGHFNDSKDDLNKRNKIDDLKIEICKNNNISLIQISYQIKPEKMGNLLKIKLKI